ncbi:MAG: family 78 glycoside hydrolase catalytic domain [Acidobacteriaceae bacterium]
MMTRSALRPAILAATLLTGATLAHAASELAPPAGLTCEHQSTPLVVTAPQPRFSWMLSVRDSAARGVRQSAWRLLVSSSLDHLQRDSGDLWDSGRVASDRTIDIAYEGHPLAPEQKVFWKVEVWDELGAPSGWSTPAAFVMAPAHWTAQWIAAAPAGSDEGRAEGATRPMPIFRHRFAIDKPVARALLYVSGMGQDEVHLNGAKVGDRELTPGWTDYRKTVLYDTWDVSPLLHRGDNAIGVMLGNGMFNVARTPGRYTKLVGSFGQPKCWLELHLLFRDGTRTVIASGPDWQFSAGPITFSSTYGGEDYDARNLPPGFDSPHITSATAWRPAFVVPGPGGALHPEVTAPIRVEHVYHPVSRKALPSGALVFDLGQNFAGWPDIVAQGEAGARVKLICGELLAADGSVSQLSANAGPRRGAQWFTYTLNGPGVEHWHPRFSYYGFRYVQVEITGKAQLLSLAGDAVHSSATLTGTVTTSIPLINRIHTLILMAIENNMESVLTDCPHREKLAWLEQTHLMGSAINFDFDLERLYNKIDDDIHDEQQADGRVPTTAPRYTFFGKEWDGFNDSPEWGSAAVLDPWIAYRRYGDLDALRAAWPVMRRYVDYLGSRSQNGIVDYGLGDWYDIGPKPPGYSQLTSRALTATGVYYQDIVTLIAAAHALGDSAEEARLEPLRASVARAFQQRFYHADTHEYDRDSQTANAMPLTLGITPPEDRAAVLAYLIDDIRAHNNHVTAGDVGFHYVVDALYENGASSVLLDMLLRTDSPSYGYQLAKGATALTEAWDANPHSSQDHLMLGDAEEWFYAGLGGIDVDFSRAPPDQIALHPAILSRIASANVVYRSVKGVIRVAWHQGRERTALDVTIPPNVTATVIFPSGTGRDIRESGTPVAQARGVRFVRTDGSAPAYSVVSGTWHFSIPTPTQ